MDYTFNTPLGIVIVTIDENYLQKAVDSRETKEFGTVFYLVSPDKNNVIPLNSGADTSSYMEKLRFSETDQDYQTLDNKVITARYLSSMGWYLVSATELNILWGGSEPLNLPGCMHHTLCLHFGCRTVR